MEIPSKLFIHRPLIIFEEWYNGDNHVIFCIIGGSDDTGKKVSENIYKGRMTKTL